MFRSKEFLTLLNKFGHCKHYCFSLELETAIVKAVQESPSPPPQNIICNPQSPPIFHSELDNFDMIVNELYGAGSVHTVHLILLRNIGADEVGEFPETSIPKTRERFLTNLPDDNLSDSYMTVCRSLVMVIEQNRYDQGIHEFHISTQKKILWVFVRQDHVNNIPSWCGFISLTVDIPDRIKSIGYYPVINNPITKYKTLG